MTPRVKFAVIFIVASLLLVGFFVFAFIRSRRTSATMPCLENLRQIQLAKDHWASDHDKTEQDSPTWDDIRPYFPAYWTNGEPICPNRGRYTIGRVEDKP